MKKSWDLSQLRGNTRELSCLITVHGLFRGPTGVLYITMHHWRSIQSQATTLCFSLSRTRQWRITLKIALHKGLPSGGPQHDIIRLSIPMNAIPMSVNPLPTTNPAPMSLDVIVLSSKSYSLSHSRIPMHRWIRFSDFIFWSKKVQRRDQCLYNTTKNKTRRIIWILPSYSEMMGTTGQPPESPKQCLLNNCNVSNW